MASPPSYPKRDIRRMLIVLAAIAELRPHATLVRIAMRTGLDRHTVTGLVDQARAQVGVTNSKVGTVYRIVSWGQVIRPSGARLALNPPSRSESRKPS